MMLPKKVPSWNGKAGLRPQPMAGEAASSQSGMWTPAVLTWAIMQADTSSWQLPLFPTPPFFQVGQSPMAPAKV